jgi:hypothetical protein
MRFTPIFLAALLTGCAYTQDSTKSLDNWELCEVAHDRGSISGVPEKNARTELEARGKDCKEYLEARKSRPQTIYIPPSPMSCRSTSACGTTYTQCL